MLKIEVISTIFFALAILHTFLVSPIRNFSHRFPKDSFLESLLHLLGEVEVVFGFWAAWFLITFAMAEGPTAVLEYQNSLHFTEPLFVFAVMVVAATRPVLNACRRTIAFISQILRIFLRTPETHTDLFTVLTVGTLLGSFITEPAAMTVTALLLRSMIERYSNKLLYCMIGVLFVNISIGGSLTPFAAPPILMVASKWSWDLSFVASNFGWKSAVAVVANAMIFVGIFWKEVGPGFFSLREVMHKGAARQDIPFGVTLLHFSFLIGIVATAHYPATFMGMFLLFLGVTTVTVKYQDPLKIKESLLVSFFLGGLIVFGTFQTWWLQPLLSQLSEGQLFFGATGLTAITDNAALTYLGSQVEGLSDVSKYSLVAGALAGGGLTIIANAPNPAGYSLLADKFPDRSINPVMLFVAAIIPTLVAIACLWYLPHGG